MTISTKAEEKKVRRGRKSYDMSLLIRNWGWYSLVKNEFSGITDYQLDQKFELAPEDDDLNKGAAAGDRSVFDDLRRFGRDPDAKPHEITSGQSTIKRTVFELVHEGGLFEQARDWYDSPLWELLENKDTTRSEYKESMTTELARRNIDSFEKIIEAAFDLDVARGSLLDKTRQPSSISTDPSIKNLILLCAAFREQKLSPQQRYLEHTRAILKNEISRLKLVPPFNFPLDLNISPRFNAPSDFYLFHLLDYLIEDRIFNDEWLSKDEALTRRRRPDFHSRGSTHPAKPRKPQSSDKSDGSKRRKPKYELAKLHWYIGLHLQGSPNSTRYWDRPIFREY